MVEGRQGFLDVGSRHDEFPTPVDGGAAAVAVEVGNIVDGVVKGITHFGAFVELPDGRTGLVHISEVASSYVRDVRDFLKEEDKVRVKVLSIDGKKIGLSIKQADPGYRAAPPRRTERRGGPRNFDDMLARFMKDSEDKLTTLRRREAGRGGRGGR